MKTAFLYHLASCLVISSVLSILLLGRLKGIGIATIASALLVGPVLKWLLSFPSGAEFRVY